MFASVTKKISDRFSESRKVEIDPEPDYVEPEAIITPQRQGEIMNSTPTPSMSSQQSSVFSEDSELRGSLSFTTKLEFNGRFEGDLQANGPLVIGEKAVVKADIQATSSVVIYGKVKGNVSAKEKVELGPKAHLYGDVRSPKFMISEGAIFIGRADTLDGTAKPSDEFSNLFKRLTGGGRSLPVEIEKDSKDSKK